MKKIKCICETPTGYIRNTHHNFKKIEFNIMGEGDDKGIVVWEKFRCVGNF